MLDATIQSKGGPMDQIKIGSLLKELRKEHNLSQEQLADKFNVSSRSVSRWENGNTMPDISMMIELADFYDIDIRELLGGERKSEKMDEDLKETLVMVADYTEEDKNKILNKVYFYGLAGTVFSFFTLIAFYAMPFIDFGTDIVNLTILITGVFAFLTLIAGIQLRGKMSKKRLKLLLWITVPIIILVLLAVIAFMVFLLPSIIMSGTII